MFGLQVEIEFYAACAHHFGFFELDVFDTKLLSCIRSFLVGSQAFELEAVLVQCRKALGFGVIATLGFPFHHKAVFACFQRDFGIRNAQAQALGVGLVAFIEIGCGQGRYAVGSILIYGAPIGCFYLH